jgi:hypothetical protein
MVPSSVPSRVIRAAHKVSSRVRNRVHCLVLHPVPPQVLLRALFLVIRVLLLALFLVWIRAAHKSSLPSIVPSTAPSQS